MSGKRMPPALRFLLAARRCELRGLEMLADTCELAALAGALVHALQKERGYSNLYLCSGRDSLLQALTALGQDACRAEREVRGFLERLDPDAAHTADQARLLSAIAFALYRLDELPGLRRRIRERRVQAEAAADAFTRLIGSLLAVLFEAADAALDPDVTRLLVALLNFMQGKESSGQERAWGVMGFTAGYFTDQLKTRMLGLADAQRRSFEVFAQHAAPQALHAWEQAQQHAGAVDRMRAMIQRTSQAQRVDAGLAELWFDVCTGRIDAMRPVESQSADALALQCRRRIDRAREELDNHRLLLGRFDEHASGATPAMVYSVQGRPVDVPPADGVGSDMQRPILDMMHEQALRLQRADEALAGARRTLQERRRIERAKWLLVSRCGLSEQAAHERLQRKAMEGGLPLGEVARQVLAELGET